MTETHETHENRPDHERLRTALGPYALGALPGDEVDDLERHLGTCAACRAELAEVLPAAGVLATLKELGSPPEALDAGALVPPATLGVRVVAAVEAERESTAPRRWRPVVLAVVGGAAAAAVLVVGLAVVLPQQADEEVPLEAVPVSVQPAGVRTGVEASADLVPHTWGVEVKLTASGFSEGRRFHVSIVDESGRRFPAGEFVGTGRAEMLCNLNSAVLRDDATGFEVLDARNRVVLSSQFA